MKETFKEYQELNEDDLKRLWQECFFIFDANILLDLYKYSERPRKEFFKTLNKIKSRIWLPNQIGTEYYESRTRIIKEINDSYESTKSLIKTELNKIKEKLNSKNYNYPSLERGELIELLQGNFNRLEREVNDKVDRDRQKHPNYLYNDEIEEKLSQFFKNKIGKPYSNTELYGIYKTGEIRYKNKIPPGYEDNKGNYQKFGDLIIWYQIMDIAKEKTKSIIFVTNELKPDWWSKKHNTCRIEMIKEFRNETNGLIFQMYSIENFTKEANKYLLAKFSESDIKEVKEIKESSIKLSKIKFFIDNYAHNKPNLLSYKNKDIIEKSKICGCYNCLKIFYPNQIVEWWDDEMTAVCPFCGTDSIIGVAESKDIKYILRSLNNIYF